MRLRFLLPAMTATLMAVCLMLPPSRAQQDEPALRRQLSREPLLLRKLGEEHGIQRLLRVSLRIFSGAEPRSNDDFEALAKLGIRTVVCVDSSRPNVALARRHGLRYVHIPIGYDRIAPRSSHAVIRLLQESEGPILFHCHHGRQRGPAMAAIAAIGAGSVKPDAAVRVLETAGASKHYPGLWRDVRSFTVPPPNTKLPPLVETHPVGDVATFMARLDRVVERMQVAQKLNFAINDEDSEHTPILDSQRMVRYLRSISDTRRRSAPPAGVDFKGWLKEATQASTAMHKALVADDAKAAAKHFAVVLGACSKCHDRYRNQ